MPKSAFFCQHLGHFSLAKMALQDEFSNYDCNIDHNKAAKLGQNHLSVQNLVAHFEERNSSQQTDGSWTKSTSPLIKGDINQEQESDC